MAGRHSSKRYATTDCDETFEMAKILGKAFSELPSVNSVLPHHFARMISDLADEAGCSPWMIAAPVISIAGLMIGSRTYLIVEDNMWVENPIFWCVILAFSGTNKSPAYGKILGALTRAEADIQRIVHDRSPQDTQVDDDGAEIPQKTLQFHLSGKTFEKMFDSLLENVNPELVSFEDELGSVFDKMDICHKPVQGGGGLDRTSVLSLKQGGKWEMQTLKDPNRQLKVTHVVFAGYTQPERFLSLYANNADGLMNRFNVFIPAVELQKYKRKKNGLKMPANFTKSNQVPPEVIELDQHRSVASKPLMQLSEMFRRIWLMHHDITNFGKTKLHNYWIRDDALEVFIKEYDEIQDVLSAMHKAFLLGKGGFYAKMKGEMIIVSAILHVINYALSSIDDNLDEFEDCADCEVSESSVKFARMFLRVSCNQRLALLNDRQLMSIITNIRAGKSPEESVDVQCQETLNNSQSLFLRTESLRKNCAKMIRETAAYRRIPRTVLANVKKFGKSEDIDEMFRYLEELKLGKYVIHHPKIEMGGKYAPYEMKSRTGAVFVKYVPTGSELYPVINVLHKHFGLTLRDWDEASAVINLPSQSAPLFNHYSEQSKHGDPDMRHIDDVPAEEDMALKAAQAAAEIADEELKSVAESPYKALRPPAHNDIDTTQQDVQRASRKSATLGTSAPACEQSKHGDPHMRHIDDVPAEEDLALKAAQATAKFADEELKSAAESPYKALRPPAHNDIGTTQQDVQRASRKSATIRNHQERKSKCSPTTGSNTSECREKNAAPQTEMVPVVGTSKTSKRQEVVEMNMVDGKKENEVKGLVMNGADGKKESGGEAIEMNAVDGKKESRGKIATARLDSEYDFRRTQYRQGTGGGKHTDEHVVTTNDNNVAEETIRLDNSESHRSSPCNTSHSPSGRVHDTARSRVQLSQKTVDSRASKQSEKQSGKQSEKRKYTRRR